MFTQGKQVEGLKYVGVLASVNCVISFKVCVNGGLVSSVDGIQSQCFLLQLPDFVLYLRDRQVTPLTARVTILYPVLLYHILCGDGVGTCLTRLINQPNGMGRCLTTLVNDPREEGLPRRGGGRCLNSLVSHSLGMGERSIRGGRCLTRLINHPKG